MMPRKKKKAIIIVSIIILCIIISISFILLYLNTDMFKSNAMLFNKYMGQNAENIEEVYKAITADEYEEKLKENKYTNETEAKVNYTENVGTSSESTENYINQLRLKITGQTDLKNGYNYQNINLLNNNENAMQIEYIQKDNTYGIRFSDLFNQYIMVENTNLKELFKNLDYSEEELNNINDKIEIDNLNNVCEFSTEEKENLKTKYLSIIGSGFSKENFEKKSNETIKINDRDVKANIYILKMTKEQLNDIYIKVLEELKQDEIVLNKLDALQEMANLYKSVDSSVNTDFKEKFIEKVDDTIEEINSKNIGEDEIDIEVYESNKVTIRTSIITPEYSLNFDYLPEEKKNYVQINYENKSTEDANKKTITLVKEENKKSMNYESTLGEDVKTISLQENKEVQDNDCDKNTVIKYEDSDNRVELDVKQKTKIVNEFNKEVDINEKNSIKLNDLEKEKLQEVSNRISEGISEKTEELFEKIKIEDINKVLKTIGILQESKNIEENGVTETEKNRFNSQFELLNKEGAEKEDVLKTIDIIRNNLVGIEVVSNDILKLELSKNSYDEKVTDVILKYIEKMENKEYNISIEYDNETGLAKYVVLTIVEQE